MTQKPAVVGGCSCGKVRYHSPEPAYGMTFCYCSTCRSLHGAPFAAFTNLRRQDLVWSDRDQLLELRFSKFATRTVCGDCFAPITMVYDAAPDEIGIVAASIDEGLSGSKIPRLERHIYVSQRPSWYQIYDGGKQYDGLPEGMQSLVTE